MKKMTYLALALLVGACGGSSSSSSDDTAPPALRPGVEDSSRAYKGTPSESETAFWSAIRTGNDAARADAVSKMAADVEKDPDNGYSEFLVGASAFMPSTDIVRALAAGAPLPNSAMPSADMVGHLDRARNHLTDPLYLGFDQALFGAIVSLSDPATGSSMLAQAKTNNVPATLLSEMAAPLRKRDYAAALATGYEFLEFCGAAPVDHAGHDAAAWVAKANAGQMVHRQCYSGPHAMHATEGVMLMTGDVHSLMGDREVADRYYAAMTAATNYESWPLRPLAERRKSGAEAATLEELGAETACLTCHTARLP